MRYFVIGGITELNTSENERERLEKSCIALGHAIGEAGHSLLICSPFKDSADYWVLNGFIKSNPRYNAVVELHFVDNYDVRTEIAKLEENIKPYSLVKIPYPSPSNIEKESLSYAWLLCQLQALELCNLVIAIGGKLEGAANMLILLAETKRKLLLPLSFLGGAASQAFLRIKYELIDKFGDDYLYLLDENSIKESIRLGDRLLYSKSMPNSSNKMNVETLNFFISYPRARPAEADYIETILRRRNKHVYRDESHFGAGSEILVAITSAIYQANVFIVVWCAEYACSPWCFDEFELALDLYESGKIKLLIFCVDNTRMVPKRARNLVFYNVQSREDILGHILNFLKDDSENLVKDKSYIGG